LKKIKIHVIGYLIFLSFPCFVKSQSTVDTLSFRVIDKVSGSPVALAHVINITRKEVSIADMLGYFKIPVAIGDSISITSLGYYKIVLYNWGQYSKDSLYSTIRIKPRNYELNELKFVWYSNYEGFLKGFRDIKLPLTKEDIEIEKINTYFKKSIADLNIINLPKASSGLTFGKGWLEKQNEKLLAKLEKERIRRLIERKYSADIVAAITGLRGNELFWFIEYCAFTDDFIMKSSDYEIRMKIIDKFKIYNQDKTSNEKK